MIESSITVLKVILLLASLSEKRKNISLISSNIQAIGGLDNEQKPDLWNTDSKLNLLHFSKNVPLFNCFINP